MQDDADDRVRRNLGPATEALFAAAFAEKALLTAQDAARLLGIDVSTLSQSTMLGLVPSTRISPRTVRYSERDLRLYLTSGTDTNNDLRQRVQRAQTAALAAWGTGFTNRKAHAPKARR